MPAFLIVKSMLLTGFDAPVEQVLYLDRPMQDAELLQAIARVNRPADGKNCGYVIDYVGVTRHLTAALKAYAAEDVQGSLADLSTPVAALDDLRAPRGHGLHWQRRHPRSQRRHGGVRPTAVRR